MVWIQDEFADSQVHLKLLLHLIDDLLCVGDCGGARSSLPCEPFEPLFRLVDQVLICVLEVIILSVGNSVQLAAATVLEEHDALLAILHPCQILLQAAPQSLVALMAGRAHNEGHSVSQALPRASNLRPNHELLQTLLQEDQTDFDQVHIADVEWLLPGSARVQLHL